MTKDEALIDLLEAVDLAIYSGDWKVDGACDPDAAIQRAREALAQPDDLDVWKVRALQAEAVIEKFMAQPAVAKPHEQEPVACVEYIPCCTDQTCSKCKAAIKPELICVCGAVWEGQELIYTTPQRKPLDAGEISRLWKRHTSEDGPHHSPYDDDGLEFARAIEAAHGIKEEV